MGGIFLAIGALIGALAAAFTAAVAVVKTFWPRIKKGHYGLMFKGGKLKIDKAAKVPTDKDYIGIDNAELYVERMPLTKWPRYELVMLPYTDQVAQLRKVIVDLRVNGKLVQYEVEVQTTWGIMPSVRGGINYAARAVVAGQINPVLDLGCLSGLVMNDCSLALWRVLNKPNASVADLKSNSYLFENMAPLAGVELEKKGCQLRMVTIVSFSRTPVQVFVERDQELHPPKEPIVLEQFTSPEEELQPPPELNGSTVPAMTRAGVDLGIPL